LEAHSARRQKHHSSAFFITDDGENTDELENYNEKEEGKEIVEVSISFRWMGSTMTPTSSSSGWRWSTAGRDSSNETTTTSPTKRRKRRHSKKPPPGGGEEDGGGDTLVLAISPSTRLAHDLHHAAPRLSVRINENNTVEIYLYLNK
jgi:hypothetical protein